MSVIEEIAAERRRQVEAEGWAPSHDDGHRRGEMAGAAACYALHGCIVPNGSRDTLRRAAVSDLWPWAASWWKPKDRRHDLIRAAALLVAEIERLDRAAALATKS